MLNNDEKRSGRAGALYCDAASYRGLTAALRSYDSLPSAAPPIHVDETAKFAGTVSALRAIHKHHMSRRLEDMQLSLNTRRAQGSVHPDRVREEQIARAALQERRWEPPGEISE
jgi:hypothetical protein